MRSAPTGIEMARAAATRFREAHEAAMQARDDIDTAVMIAKSEKATYGQIAEAIGFSTSWVQEALARKGYVPKSRLRSRLPS